MDELLSKIESISENLSQKVRERYSQWNVKADVVTSIIEAIHTRYPESTTVKHSPGLSQFTFYPHILAKPPKPIEDKTGYTITIQLLANAHVAVNYRYREFDSDTSETRIITQCPAPVSIDDIDNKVIISWFDQLFDIIKTDFKI